MTIPTPQHQFNVTLPTQDNAGNALSAGELTQLVFQVSAGAAPPANFTYTLVVGVSPGAAVNAPFSGTSPVFSPVAGTVYSADVFAVDSGGNGIPSASINWTQNAAVPAAPTNFSVS